MKVYLFDNETGVYEGETFLEADKLSNEEGVTAIPPPEYGDGHVVVYDKQRQAWEVIPAAVARQLLRVSTRFRSKE